MKKVYFLLFIAVAIIVLTVFMVFGPAFDKSNYSSKVAKYISDALEQDNLTAEYHDDVNTLNSRYADGLLRVLTRGVSELKNVNAPPRVYDDKLTVFFGDVILNVYCEDRKVDTVVMEYIVDGKSKCQSLSGYAAFRWMLDVTGFEAAESN
ncbi:MAG: hypothetical protein GX096_14570 [Clostridiales bacterium]|nr:hypothetical protein [Clostridiales bacterium]